MLTCAICGRRQAVGIMTAQSWGAVKTESLVAHACPNCQEKEHDWQDQLTRLVNGLG